MLNGATATLDYFLRLQRTLVIETREFKDKHHNKDLCPGLQHQLEAVLNATGRFEPIVYDTQGFFDQGADIVVRVRDQRRLDHEPPEMIGFQIKSFGDFRAGDIFRTLKAQRDDALRKIANLTTYYLVLCTDELKDKDTIRNIEAEFKEADRTIVIEPTFALGFLRLSERRIQGTVTRLQHSEDLVFRRAMATIDLGSPTAGLLALYLATRECEGTKELNTGSLQHQRSLEEQYKSTLESRRALAERYREAVDEEEDSRALRERIQTKTGPSAEELERASEVFFEDFDEALAYDLEVLDSSLIDIDSSSGRITLRRDSMLPLIALLTDAQVRYELEGDELFLYGAEALGLTEAESSG